MAHRDGRDGTVLDAPGGTVTVTRDGFGIPTIRAGTAGDAWWGLGYAAAQDRLWQMEYDRRRAAGRWAEVVGPVGIDADRLARRLGLVDAAKTDVAAMDPHTRASFERYAAGVNAYVAGEGALPREYAASGTAFEPWEPWQSVAAFKVRHVLMGSWQHKLMLALLVAREGVEVLERLDTPVRAGMRLTTPAGARQGPLPEAERNALAAARDDLAAAARELGFLAEVEAGSNAWVVAGSRTAHGHPVLCNDSHRAVDVPNVYWQARLECPEFSVTGATFPGFPGFPHFGNNGRVGWAITHAAADAQDLLTERFRPAGSDTARGTPDRGTPDSGAGGELEVLTPDGWRPASHTREEIGVRGAEAVTLDCYRTPNGPVVHGDPASGVGLALRWTATEGPCEQFGVPGAMLRAGSVDELLDAQAPWVDPVNNLLAADTAGNIGYLLRGALPRRVGDATQITAAHLPLPGFQEHSRWAGRVPFARMPRETNPQAGFFVTSNNAVTAGNTVADAGGGVLVSQSVSDFFRAERIHELLESSRAHTVEDLTGFQNDTVSVAARRWSAHLAARGPYRGDAELARRCLTDWDGDLAAPRPAGLVYAHFRRELAQVLLGGLLSEPSRKLLLGGEDPAGGALAKRWVAQLVWAEPGAEAPAAGIADADLQRTLERAWAASQALAGTSESATGRDPERWRWADHHLLQARHTFAGTDLAEGFPSPPPVHVAGDAETVQCAAYGWVPGSLFTVTNCPVYRQVLDFSDLSKPWWIIPGGACARTEDPHYADQLPLWGAGVLIRADGSTGTSAGTSTSTSAVDAPASEESGGESNDQS